MTQLLLDIQPTFIPTLDNFIVGSNEELLAALRQGQPRLYLWGPAGCGKTHLLTAMMQRVDVGVDDVHQLSEAQQIDLFRAFNQGRALLLAGDRPPSRLTLREDLRTRIAQCLVFEIRPLSDEDKLAALNHHARMRAMQIPESLLRYMLSHGRRDWPSLIGLLNRLDQLSLEQHRVITLPLLKETLMVDMPTPDNETSQERQVNPPLQTSPHGEASSLFASLKITLDTPDVFHVNHVMNLALFDLDNTLLAGDSDFEWAQFLISKGVLDRELTEAKNQAFYDEYKQGALDIHAFLDFQLAPLSRHSRGELEGWHREFMATRIIPLMTEKARALVQHHLKSGDVCAIVTATNSFVTGPIAQAFGVAHLVATIPAWENGRFTGKPRGTPSFQAGKIERVEAWLESLGLWWSSFDHSFFYSDSHNDLPLMSKVTHPVAVDPDNTLRTHAQDKGWPVMSLR